MTPLNCVGCGTTLPDRARGSRCPRCRPAYQRERNRAKARRSRERRRERADSRAYALAELAWLESLGLGLEVPIRNMEAWLDSTAPESEAQANAWAAEALRIYDANREEFDRRAAATPDPQGFAAGFRDWCEIIRERVP